jgi:hypothetical protein
MELCCSLASCTVFHHAHSCPMPQRLDPHAPHHTPPLVKHPTIPQVVGASELRPFVLPPWGYQLAQVLLANSRRSKPLRISRASCLRWSTRAIINNDNLWKQRVHVHYGSEYACLRDRRKISLVPKLPRLPQAQKTHVDCGGRGSCAQAPAGGNKTYVSGPRKHPSGAGMAPSRDPPHWPSLKSTMTP